MNILVLFLNFFYPPLTLGLHFLCVFRWSECLSLFYFKAQDNWMNKWTEVNALIAYFYTIKENSTPPMCSLNDLTLERIIRIYLSEVLCLYYELIKRNGFFKWICLIDCIINAVSHTTVQRFLRAHQYWVFPLIIQLNVLPPIKHIFQRGAHE